jgi:peroxidase
MQTDPHRPGRGALLFAQLCLVAVASVVLGGVAFAQEWRTIDGSGNNVSNPEFGSVDAPLVRKAPAGYGDAVSTPAGGGRPSARAISNALCEQFGTVGNLAGVSDMFWLFGQFLDHDIDLTGGADPEQDFDIVVPEGDPHFDFFATGNETIPLDRSAYDPTTGTGSGNPRQQINQITAFIDASNVYGSDATRAQALRRNKGKGYLETSRGKRPPFNEPGLPNAGGDDNPELFLAGDVRANEHVGLTAMHMAFMREHNRLARLIRRGDRSLTGDEIYERARARVGAQLQAITYEEFLPVLLGPGALAPYAGYNPSVNPGIANEFSTAAYRFGHTMLSPQLQRLRRTGDPYPRGPLQLREAFFNPRMLRNGGPVEHLWRGLAAQLAQRIDLLVVNEVRNFLFGFPGAGGFDLASLNIQRGRDHGLADYNAMRVAYGLAPAASFADITSDVDLQQDLATLYGTVDNIDPWVGGLAEDHVPGALVGELFWTVITDQFERLRDGDRFFYENVFTGEELAELKATRLADVLRRNFRLRDEISDQIFTGL